jgi:hypothetical protein
MLEGVDSMEVSTWEYRDGTGDGARDFDGQAGREYPHRRQRRPVTRIRKPPDSRWIELVGDADDTESEKPEDVEPEVCDDEGRRRGRHREPQAERDAAEATRVPASRPSRTRCGGRTRTRRVSRGFDGPGWRASRPARRRERRPPRQPAPATTATWSPTYPGVGPDLPSNWWRTGTLAVRGGSTSAPAVSGRSTGRRRPGDRSGRTRRRLP